MKTIFLDFDGVIRVSPEGPWLGADAAYFCPARMKLVATIAESSGAKIVISSDWRRPDNLPAIRKLLFPYLHHLLHEHWCTPITGQRWEEVGYWLEDHREVTSYLILEDVARHFEGCPAEMQERLMLCSNRHGIVPQMVSKGIGMLTHSLIDC